MAIFRRNRRVEEKLESVFENDLSTTPEKERQEQVGPRDSGGAPAPEGFLDLGAIYVPTIPGIQLRAQFESDKTTLRRILLVTGTSGIQVSIAAAPRSGDIWPELSEQISASIANSGGNVSQVEGRYGQELQGKVPVQLPDGSKGMVPLRIVGIEGPRWVARIDIQGAAAAGDEEQIEACHQIIDQLIVNRGSEPRVRLELLPLRLPKGAAKDNGTT